MTNKEIQKLRQKLYCFDYDGSLDVANVNNVPEDYDWMGDFNKRLREEEAA